MAAHQLEQFLTLISKFIFLFQKIAFFVVFVTHCDILKKI